jgi:glycosyltransferase involved in cell wall biosynthesis
MNIVYIYQYFGTPNGGWSTRVYEFTKRWVDKGHEVTVITSPYYKSDIKARGFISKQNVEGIKLIVINSGDSNKHGFLKRLFNAAVFSVVSIFYALALPANAIIASSGPITTAIPALFAKWLRNIPMVFEVRDLWPLGGIELGKIKNPFLIKFALWFEKLCYKNSELIIPCSIGMDNAVKEIRPEAKTNVIPNASDINLFNIPTTNPQTFPISLTNKSIFLYAGSLGFMDDCSQIIKAMYHVKDLNIALVFAGDGAERKELESIAQETHNPNILFLGLLPKTEIIKWFSIATASFVTFKDSPVLHTTSPNKMFDSFAAGVPIIQSTKGWIKELVSSKNCGINVSPDSPKEFAAAMQKLANNKSLHKIFSSNARQLAYNNFDRDMLSEEYLNSLLKINE